MLVFFVFLICSDDKHVILQRRLARFGSGQCGGLHEEHACGRVLGLRMDKNTGDLVAIDCYHGLFRVNKYTGEYVMLYDARTPVGGITPKLLNDLDIAEDGKIYFTGEDQRKCVCVRDCVLNACSLSYLLFTVNVCDMQFNSKNNCSHRFFQ